MYLNLGLLSAYWPRGDVSSSNAASLFAAGGGFGLPPHPSLPFGMLPPTTGRGMSPYPTSTAAAAYSNAYTNTLSVAATQAASLGIPAASKLTLCSLISNLSIKMELYFILPEFMNRLVIKNHLNNT